MSEIVINIHFPLDNDGFFRRECPLCQREFKVKPTEQEIRAITERSTHALLSMDAASEIGTNDDGSEEAEQAWCPYCAQQASLESWWTQEQLAFIQVHQQNTLARVVNEELIRPMKRTFGGSGKGPFSITFKGEEMKPREAWISPEPNDMIIVPMPCCKREIKILDSWSGRVTCFFCGFPHRPDGLSHK
jgi:uncharacterized Zn-finger protein